MKPVVAVLSTLDTKGAESQFLRECIEGQGCDAMLIDVGVVGEPAARPDVTRAEVAAAGGKELAEILKDPTRQDAAPIMTGGAIAILQQKIAAGQVQALLGLGGTQGTSTCTEVMRALPYGFPKLMVSTMASGDTSAFVDIKDITMMFSVSDILGLNPFMRKILAKAAGAACGMAKVDVEIEQRDATKPLIGISNLGVLTAGAMHAIELFEKAGYETIVFHAVGSGGRAMEQMMKEGLIGAVFDYAMGEIADDVFSALRAGGPERLTVAGPLGLPQVICPGGAEHVGLLVEPNVLPERWSDHQHVFHSPIILAPRLKGDELVQVAEEIGRRLQHTRGKACMLIPTRGSSRYAIEGGILRDPEGDRAFFDALEKNAPDAVEVIRIDAAAEDPEFVEAAVARLIAMIES